MHANAGDMIHTLLRIPLHQVCSYATIGKYSKKTRQLWTHMYTTIWQQYDNINMLGTPYTRLSGWRLQKCAWPLCNPCAPQFSDYPGAERPSPLATVGPLVSIFIKVTLTVTAWSRHGAARMRKDQQLPSQMQNCIKTVKLEGSWQPNTFQESRQVKFV